MGSNESCSPLPKWLKNMMVYSVPTCLGNYGKVITKQYVSEDGL